MSDGVLQCIVWNVNTSQAAHVIQVHADLILSLAWNRTGSLFATTSRDGRIRVIEPRSGSVVSVRSSLSTGWSQKTKLTSLFWRQLCRKFDGLADRSTPVGAECGCATGISSAPPILPHHRRVKPCPHCHRKRRLLLVVAVFGDSRRFRRQIVAEIGDYSRQCGQAVRPMHKIY